MKKAKSLIRCDTFCALAGLLAFSALVRAVLLITYPPAVYPDTGTYLSLARQIASLDINQYERLRTPTYPLLIALAGLNAYGVYLVQTVLGLAAGVLLFFTVLDFKRNHALAILAGLVP